ncbi:hypothetical protein NDU88_003660 [Pleurodeles waltl]|uniref:Uncharacterized protein n=1 Tax=Pleurodeles waltl TaxID=8319 RepID=A0AAV7T5G3_PLEWA|nr:hypothetical protein NDU88_003660 [Pleurodeles waltl]
MGTLTDTSNPDIRVFSRKERTDSQEGEEEFRTKERKMNEERTANAEKEQLHLEKTPDAENEQLQLEETPETRDEDFPRNPDAKAYESRHDPGGSWLSKPFQQREYCRPAVALRAHQLILGEKCNL